MPLSDKAARADILISNNGSIDDLRKSVKSIWPQVHADS
jgi:dephospho-CoA kinase